ncbi:MAG: hypothetical protein AB7I24_04690 [Candidatus Nanopelagicales bacterium]
MGPGPDDDARSDPGRRFAAQLERTVDRLRGLGLARLSASFEPEPTRAAAARGLAQWLADGAAGLEGGPSRPLPALADAAAGDQVAVCGHDLLAAASERLGDPAVASLLDEAAERLLDLRRRL